MTWRPDPRPDLISDPYKEPIGGYTVTVNDGDGSAGRNNATFTTISDNAGCAEMFALLGDVYWKLGAGCTRTDYHGILTTDPRHIQKVAFPKVGDTDMSFIKKATGAGDAQVVITAYNRES